MAFWNKNSNNNNVSYGNFETQIFTNEYPSELNLFLRRIIRDALSLEYVGLDEDIKDTLFNNFKYNNETVFSLQELLIKILGRRGQFSVITGKNINQITTFNEDIITQYNVNSVLGYANNIYNKEYTIQYNYSYLPLSQYEYLFELQRLIFNNMLASINLSNKPVLKIENGKESIENVESFKAKAAQVLKSLTVDQQSMVFMGDKDSIDILITDFDNYTKAFNVIDKDLARISGFPLTYIQGVSATGFSATGEGDRIQEEKALVNFSNQNILPLLNEIQKRFGSGKQITIKPPVSLQFEDVTVLSEVMQAVEFSQVITSTEKRLIVQQYIPNNILKEAKKIDKDQQQEHMNNIEEQE